MRWTYEWSTRRLIMRGNRSHGDDVIEPYETMAKINRSRDISRMLERCGGWDMYCVRIASGL
jgi:hypothetical protein